MQDLFREMWELNVPEFSDRFLYINEFFEELQYFNSKVNFISRKMAPEMIFKDHILDCALGAKYMKKYREIYDFGTGGGLPGVIIAICCPDSRVNLIDKSDKKRHYLKQLIQELQISNVEVCEKKLEIQDPEAIVSRAVGPISKLLKLYEEVFRLEGVSMYFYKAKMESIQQELSSLDSKFKSEIFTLAYPQNEKERHLVKIDLK